MFNNNLLLTIVDNRKKIKFNKSQWFIELKSLMTLLFHLLMLIR